MDDQEPTVRCSSVWASARQEKKSADGLKVIVTVSEEEGYAALSRRSAEMGGELNLGTAAKADGLLERAGQAQNHGGRGLR